MSNRDTYSSCEQPGTKVNVIISEVLIITAEEIKRVMNDLK